jgi:hypothetical protein
LPAERAASGDCDLPVVSRLPKHPRRQEREIVRLRAAREIVLNVGENRVE